MAERKKAGWFRYIKEAFTFRWNLLFFGGAMAAAAISGAPDIMIPLVAAAEVTYLAGLTSLPRFQFAIDAKARSEERGLATSSPAAVAPQKRLSDVLSVLDPQRRNRFLRLRARCVEMSRIASGVRGDTQDVSGAASELRTPALDRLLWVFLRLLVSRQALEKFVAATDGATIEKQLSDLRARETAATAKGDDRILRSITDSIATAELRLENYRKAQSNLEFVEIELDRIEGKIQALTEMAISHQDPDEISVQVDAVADGMAQTEATIKELQHITGISADVEGTPAILEADIAEVVTR